MTLSLVITFSRLNMKIKPSSGTPSGTAGAAMANPHFLLVTYPAQGHINPTLQFAKRLIQIGVEVTFVTGVSAHRRMVKAPSTAGLTFTTFPDGCDEWGKVKDNFHHHLSEIKRLGTQTLKDIIRQSNEQGRPVTCLVHSILLPWAAGVASSLDVPSALLWIQTATVLDIYYYYFNGYGDLIRNNSSDSWVCIDLPGLQLLGSDDIPSFLPTSGDISSFLNSSNIDSTSFLTFREQVEVLSQQTNPNVLVNTFDELEAEALQSVRELNLIGVGPLIPSAFLDGKDPTDICFGGDIFYSSANCIKWLDSKPMSSVIYLSFGTLCTLSKPQMEEIAKGLLDSGRPFLWTTRSARGYGEDREEEKLSFREELEQKGMIVAWCSQLEVLSHPSLGCFVTHCGWNSTLESLTCGVPVVAIPQWTDQATNAKLITDMWKTGVRGTVNEEGIVEADELKRSLEIVMGDGERAGEIRKNAQKWKHLAREAVKDGGSSDKNLKAFVDKIAGEWSIAEKWEDLARETTKHGGFNSDKKLKAFVDEAAVERAQQLSSNGGFADKIAQEVAGERAQQSSSNNGFAETNV